jgi:type II secretory ATPase GspE/PulE/Tfp pilus assembly ATPase PilB-like protein
MTLSGINQVSINHKLGLDFATVLRAMLRQDPDVLMVGEIRDQETAEIALKAAQTGHLVLATMHCNHSLEALTRLRYLGADMDHITSALKLVLAQRLVRMLCPQCHGHHSSESSHENRICDYCVQGYKGRIGIFESFSLTCETSDILLGSACLMSAKAKLDKQVSPVLREAGQSKIDRGVTDADELERAL